MNHLQTIQTLLGSFKLRADEIRNRKESQIEEINRTFLPDKRAQRIQAVESEADQQLSAVRSQFKDDIEKKVIAIKSMQKRAFSDQINTEVLQKLTVISAANIALTAEELHGLAQEVLRSNSRICVRKLREMAKNSGFRLQMPDPDEAIQVLDNVQRKAVDLISKYESEKVGFGYDAAVAIGIRGSWLTNYDEQLDRCSASAVTIEKDALAILEGTNEELPRTDFTVSAEPIRTNAGEIAKQHSRRAFETGDYMNYGVEGGFGL